MTLQRKTPLKRAAMKQAPAKRKKRRGKSPMARADEVFSKYVRLREPACTRCGTTDSLQCAHFFSRRYKAIRCDTRNATTLCRGCHLFFTVRPIEEDEWRRERLGDVLYEELRVLARDNQTKPDWAQITRDLEVLVTRLEAGW